MFCRFISEMYAYNTIEAMDSDPPHGQADPKDDSKPPPPSRTLLFSRLYGELAAAVVKGRACGGGGGVWWGCCVRLALSPRGCKLSIYVYAYICVPPICLSASAPFIASPAKASPLCCNKTTAGRSARDSSLSSCSRKK